ncbi:MAG: hypothetical protein V7727_10420 [Sneathiella sp.]
MRKILVLLLFVTSMVLFGSTINAYFTSGEEVISVPVQGRLGTLDPILLNPGMSPVRIILNIRSEMHIQDNTNDAYQFQVDVKDRANTQLFSFTGAHSEKKDDKGSEFRRITQNHVVGTFDIPGQGPYLVDWRLDPKRANITSIKVSIRRNVEGLNIPLIVIAGLCFVLAWAVLLVGRRK